MPGCEVVGVVGRTPERAQEFATKNKIPRGYGDYRQLVDADDVDLICVTTPNPRHCEEVTYALRRGKHVLAEKPLAMTLSETISLRDLAASVGRIAIVDHQLRFNPYLRTIRTLVREGRLGRLYYVNVHQQLTGFSDPKAPWNWSFDAENGGGVRLAMCSHLIDLLFYWIGAKNVSTVTGNMDVVLPTRRDNNGESRRVDASGFFSTVLSVDDGLTAHLVATAAAFSEARFDVSMYGTEGEVHFDLQNKLRGSFSDTRGALTPIQVDGVTQEERDNKVSIFKGSFVYFAPCIVTAIKESDSRGLLDAAHFEDAVRTQTILDAVRDSALQGRAIPIASSYSCNARM